jgi:hypothetical protein
MTDHHPDGPSIIERKDPKRKGCKLFESAKQAPSERTVSGTKGHEAFAKRDLSLCDGDTNLELQVSNAIDFFDRFRGDFPINYHEIRLEIPGLNFGTLDLLAFSADRTRALIGDLKFGLWPVTKASLNLQLRNYALLVFHCYPQVRSVRCVIYHAQYAISSMHLYQRRAFPRMLHYFKTLIASINAARTNPQRKDYTPSASLCGFCARLNCPARLELTSQVLTWWTGTPCPVLDVNLAHVDNVTLSSLKKLNNALKTLSRAIDQEAHVRMVDNHEPLPGYEVREQSSPRRIIGAQNFQKTVEVLNHCFDGVLEDRLPGLQKCLLANVELSWADLERAIKEVVPNTRFSYYSNLILTKLTEAKLIDAHPVFAVRQIRNGI